MTLFRLALPLRPRLCSRRQPRPGAQGRPRCPISGVAEGTLVTDLERHGNTADGRGAARLVAAGGCALLLQMPVFHGKEYHRVATCKTPDFMTKT